MPHFHAWIGSGRIMTMNPRAFDSRTSAHRWGWTSPAGETDRIVVACDGCPAVSRSKRRAPRRSAVARTMAERFGLSARELREALADALATERARNVEEQTVGGTAR